MAAEGDRVAERRDKYFAVWTGAEVTADLSTDVRGEFVIDIGRELLEQVQATAWLMRVVRRWPRRTFRTRCGFLGHACDPLDSFNPHYS